MEKTNGIQTELEELRTFLKKTVQSKQVSGVSLLLVYKGQMVFKEAYGLADIKEKKAFNTDTIVWIRSSSKPIVSTAIMTLVDEGKISLDEPVSKYLPGLGLLKVRGSGGMFTSPTMRQLLSHTSGLIAGNPPASTTASAIRIDMTLEESANACLATELLWPPGRRFAYGAASFQVAARVAEVISGNPFDFFLKERVLEPLEMKETGFRPDAALWPRFARVYDPELGGLKETPGYWEPSQFSQVKLLYTSGGLYSTLSDLSKFLTMHLNGGKYNSKRIISVATAAEMAKNQTRDAELGFSPYPGKKDYGIGWIVDRMKNGKTLSISHGGQWGSIQWIDFDCDLYGVLFAPQPLRSTEVPIASEQLRGAHPILHKPIRDKVLEIFPMMSSAAK